NIAAFGDGEEPIVVNSAGCGAILKDYGRLVGDAPAHALGARVRDVTELLADRGPRPGAPLDRRVAYDPPCHLLHAQRVAEAPHRLLGAIPVLQLVPTPDAAQCCGSAGLFTLVEPAMSRAVLAPKLAALREAGPQVVAPGNPGCLMQLGAGLAAAGMAAEARHPVELLADGAFVYGALLTPKGMIVVDGCATRPATTVSYTVPAHGRERTLEMHTRSVPPRLARLADRTAELAVLRLTGPRAQAVAEAAGLAMPSAAGRAVQAVTGDAGADVARPGDAAPFALQVTLPADRADALRERLVAG